MSKKLVQHSNPGERIGPTSMRQINGALLLNLIRDRGSISRAELARVSGLTKPTVSSQVAELVRRGVVREDGEGAPDSRGGKPSRLLRFDAKCALILGVEIGASEVRAALADLDGVILERGSVAIHPERGATVVLAALEKLAKELIAGAAGRKRKLLAMGVAAPGRVDSQTGVILEAGNVFHWRNVAVKKTLERSFPAQIAVENDVNLAVLGEMHEGAARGARNFVLIRLTTGIGAGIVLGGQLYQGSHWAAGEIGHMPIDHRATPDGPNDRGDLELASGMDRLRERLKSTLSDNAAGNRGLVQALAEAVRRNDPVATAVVEDLALHLGAAITNLTVAIDPELIVLDGEPFDLVIDRIQESVKRVVPWPVRIERSALGDEAVLLGAINVARGLASEVISAGWTAGKSGKGSQ